MFTNRFFNLIIAAALAVAIVIIFSVGQAGAMKTLHTDTNNGSRSFSIAESNHSVDYIGGEPAYQLSNGQWVR